MIRSVKAFTLVEILVVVVLLGILAAIVVPRLSNASDAARETVLRNHVRIVRTQVELYKLQHDDMYPGYVTQSGGLLSSWDGGRFVLQLVGTTTITGDLTGTDCGPYLERFPLNGYVSDPSSAASVKEGDPDAKPLNELRNLE